MSASLVNSIKKVVVKDQAHLEIPEKVMEKKVMVKIIKTHQNQVMSGVSCNQMIRVQTSVTTLITNGLLR